jgi:cytochrome c oxidase cbb3-type subunit 3
VQSPTPLSARSFFKSIAPLVTAWKEAADADRTCIGPTLKHASDEKGLRALIGNGISPQMPPAWFLTEDEIASVASYVLTLGSVPREKVPGDPAVRPCTLKPTAICATRWPARETVLGLTSPRSERDAEQLSLRQTLQHPDRTIPDGFLLVEAVLPSGDVIRGMRMNEDSFSIQIRDFRAASTAFARRT